LKKHYLQPAVGYKTATKQLSCTCWRIAHARVLNSHGYQISEDFRFLHPIIGKRLHHILDWHHLARRCSQLFSQALKGKELARKHRTEVKRLLWFGCTDKAIAYLKTIPDEEIRNQKKLTELGDYLERRKSQIPVYAVRRKLDMPNSSNRVEKANDLIVSSRQKGQGMSWSQDGSSALASVRMVIVNRQTSNWVNFRKFSLKLSKSAA